MSMLAAPPGLVPTPHLTRRHWHRSTRLDAWPSRCVIDCFHSSRCCSFLCSPTLRTRNINLRSYRRILAVAHCLLVAAPMSSLLSPPTIPPEHFLRHHFWRQNTAQWTAVRHSIARTIGRVLMPQTDTLLEGRLKAVWTPIEYRLKALLNRFWQQKKKRHWKRSAVRLAV